jgi:hypothetical protein
MYFDWFLLLGHAYQVYFDGGIRTSAVRTFYFICEQTHCMVGGGFFFYIMVYIEIGYYHGIMSNLPMELLAGFLFYQIFVGQRILYLFLV